MDGETISAESRQPIEPKKRPRVRLWFVATVLGLAAFYAWLLWPSSESGIDAFTLSREDGKSRFYPTTYSKMQMPPHLTLYQRAFWTWMEYQRRHGKRNPATFSFPASPVTPCSIHGLLNQCMEVTGTRYLIAVEIGGGVDFGNTNTLSGAQWVAAFEHAIETSDSVMCYDYAKKQNFQDTLLLIRERPGLVKVVPRSKLAEYQKAGLVRANEEKSENRNSNSERSPKSE
jgi:hypothetical protein